jgi:hypothetical protein
MVGRAPDSRIWQPFSNERADLALERKATLDRCPVGIHEKPYHGHNDSCTRQACFIRSGNSYRERAPMAEEYRVSLLFEPERQIRTLAVRARADSPKRVEESGRALQRIP